MKQRLTKNGSLKKDLEISGSVLRWPVIGKTGLFLALMWVCIFSVTALGSGRSNHAPWKFAADFEQQEMLKSPECAARFCEEYFRWEANFFAIARDPQSGFIFDGINLEPNTGLPAWFRYWSAPSKESLDIGLLTKIIQKHPLAWLLMGVATPEQAQMKAIQLLQKKLAGYWKFHRDFPGLGGFMPWYAIIDRPGVKTPRVAPINDWLKGKIGDLPALDNGEWAWSLITLEHVLRKQKLTALAEGFRNFNALQSQNAVRLFWDSQKTLVRDARVLDVSDRNSPAVFAPRMGYMTGEHGVHEASMIIAYMSLFAPGLSDDERKGMWRGVSLKKVDTRWGPTWQGYWGSSHEEWAYLFMPLLDIPEFRTLFQIRQIIRTQSARAKGYAGLAASVIAPDKDAYYSACGIEEIATKTIEFKNIFALYGAFPVILNETYPPPGPSEDEDPPTHGNMRGVGLTWLLSLLKAPKMQGPLGSGEATTSSGTARILVKSVDGTFPILLAMCGGVVKETAEMLRDQGKWDLFRSLFLDQFNNTFKGVPLKSSGDVVPPATIIPLGQMPDFYFPSLGQNE